MTKGGERLRWEFCREFNRRLKKTPKGHGLDVHEKELYLHFCSGPEEKCLGTNKRDKREVVAQTSGEKRKTSPVIF